MFRLITLALCVGALLAFGTQARAQTTLTATFSRGAIAEYQNNPNQTDNGQLFGPLAIASMSISQVSANGMWGGTQGNDTSVTATINFTNGSSVSFPAAVNWVRNAGGGVFHWVGLSISSGTVVADGYSLSAGKQKTYVLQFSQSALDLATLVPSDLDGSANAGQALSALNQYVPYSAPLAITGPSGGEGAASSALSVNENQTAVTTLTANKSVTWALTGGTDQGRFAISNAGAITFLAAPDYEAPTDSDSNNTYVLVAEATDTDGGKATQTVTVTVLNLPDTAPVITGPSGGAGAAASALSVNENQTAVTTLSANKSVTWALTGGADQGRFAISAGGVITFLAAPDYETPTDSDTNNTYVLAVEATEADGLKGTQTVTVTVLDLPDTPPVVTGPSGGAGAAASAISVNENQTAVTTLTANKPVTWAVVGGTDQGRFAISAGGVITFLAAPDYETPTDSDTDNTYVLAVEATDADGLKGTQTVTVTVLDLADTAPVITGPSGAAGAAASAISVNENQTAVTTLTASKPVTWALVGGTDEAKFEISTGGVITFLAAPDYEAPTDSDTNNTYVLVAEATDADGLKATQTVTVTVLNLVDTAPVVTGPSGGAGAAASSVSVNENQTAVTTLFASKPVTWTFVGGSDRGRFRISAAGVITFLAAPDFEAPEDADTDNVYVLIVEATDDEGATSIQTVTVTVLNVVDTAPTITGPAGGAGAAASAISVNENQTAVTTLIADQPVTWALVGGPDQARFAVSPAGVITFLAAPDYETPTDSDTNNTYVLIVEATDAGGGKSTQTITVTVLNLVDTTPVITGPSGGAGAAASAISINENQTAVTTLSANQPVTWALAGGPDQGKFAISTTGVITFLTAPDYEAPTDADANNAYVLIVRATDAGGGEATQTLTVTVLNVDELSQKLAEISGKLRGGLRDYAFDNLQSSLAINEDWLRGGGELACGYAGDKPVSTSLSGSGANVNAGVGYSMAAEDCQSRTRVFVNAGAYLTRQDGDTDTHSFGSVRIEREFTDRLLLGAGVTAAFGDNDLAAFADSRISDSSAQLNVYGRYSLTERLRVGGFAGVGRAWYAFDLKEDGLSVSGEMTGDRLVYGAMLSGDVAKGDVKVTVDAIVWRATEDLDEARLDAAYAGEARSNIALQVGQVDATRISVPVHFVMGGGDRGPADGRSVQFGFSPGLLCEDQMAGGSGLTCGYQLGGRVTARLGGRSDLLLQARHEEVDGRVGELVSLGYSRRFGPKQGLQLNISLDRRNAEDRADHAVMVRLIAGR